MILTAHNSLILGEASGSLNSPSSQSVSYSADVDDKGEYLCRLVIFICVPVTDVYSCPLSLA